MLDRIEDPEERELQRDQMPMQKRASLSRTLVNMAEMRHEMLRAVAQNLRGSDATDDPKPPT